MNDYLRSLQSEWMKTRNTAASWLVIIGSFFIPLIMVIIGMANADKLPGKYSSPVFWQNHFAVSWQIMAFLLLPMGVILATSLITQIEYRNNTWKQLHATPQRFAVVFFAKLSVIILMMLQFFVLFNIGIYLSGIIPLLFSKTAAYPVQGFPFVFFLKNNAQFFIDCLPIIALQYLISLQFRNFMVPLGAGIVLLVAATFAIQWKYGYIVPYTYAALNYFQLRSATTQMVPVNIHLLAVGYFTLFIIVSFIFYTYKKDKC
ncbi:MAG: ABC transporter permease [Chitinophagaceae bacterium]|nr:ABC transporter permease [Chitinophagaceae bacterium]